MFVIEGGKTESFSYKDYKCCTPWRSTQIFPRHSLL